jgi:hypothetical protein
LTYYTDYAIIIEMKGLPESDSTADQNIGTQNFPILIYRGIQRSHKEGRMGSWWTNDPYLALHYSDQGKGDMFVANIDNETFIDLKDEAFSGSYGQGADSYYLRNDPPNARIVTPEEINELKTAPTYRPPEYRADGTRIVEKTDNGIEIGYRIFGTKDPGFIAVSETVTILEDQTER